MGNNRLSIFHHNLRSCSGVKSGGCGSVESPPKSIAVALVLGIDEVSDFAPDSLPLDMAGVRVREGRMVQG